MIASGITREQLELAAERVCVSVDCAPLNARGTRWCVKVRPKVSDECYRWHESKGDAFAPGAFRERGCRYEGARGDAPYQRVRASERGQRVQAVCWHGFRDYFRACFALAPDATFRTALDHWRGAADFENRFEQTAARPTGPRMFGFTVSEVCACPESSTFDRRGACECPGVGNHSKRCTDDNRIAEANARAHFARAASVRADATSRHRVSA